MAQILTADMITREAQDIFHQKATFIGSINRQYDDSFAKSGAKIGDTLRLRLPNEYEVGDGAAITPQETFEINTSLRISTQKHVALQFSAVDLTLSLDDFSTRILAPAVSKLAAAVESDVLVNCSKQVPRQLDQNGSAFTFDTFLGGEEILNNELVPMDGRRSAVLSNRHARKFMDGFKANFNPQNDLSKQFREGSIGRVAGLDVYAHSMVQNLTTGTCAEGDSAYRTNQVAAQTGDPGPSGMNLVVNTGTGTFKKGEIIEIQGVNRVHKETKADSGELQQFVVTADVAANATSIPIYPAMVATGARQNVTNGAANNKIVYKRGAGNAEQLNMSLAYHEEFATFATADLVMPEGVHFGARKVKDGISLRIVQDYQILSDLFIGRIDILYGYAVKRPEMAARLHADG